MREAKTIEGKELETLNSKLETYRWQWKRSWGLHNISGGFVSIEVSDYDNDHIYLEVKSGVQSDCTNNVDTENMKMNRETLEVY